MNKQQFVGHTNKHEGKRPFVCELCGKGFYFKSDCTKHEKVVHKNVVMSL